MSLISVFPGGGGKPKGTRLGDLPLMSVVQIAENGVLHDFYVVRHNAYTSGRTLLLRKRAHSARQWHNSSVNAYATCDLDAWFNGEYFNSLPADIRGQIAAVQIDYTPGNNNWTVTKLSRKVFALSGTELAQSHQYMKEEGTALANAAELKIALDMSGAATTQWTRSPNTGSTTHAWHLGTVGSLGDNYCSITYGARPAFTLPSNMEYFAPRWEV